MIKTCILILLLTSCTVYAKDLKVDAKGQVFYFPFQIDRYTGYFEQEIVKSIGCWGEISQSNFEKLLKPTNQIYDPRDVRAKIMFKHNTFFIDNAGVVSDHKETYQLVSKKAFDEAILDDLQCLNGLKSSVGVYD